MYYYIRNLYHWRKLEDLRQLKIKCINKGKLQDVISCDSEGKLLDKYQLTSLSTQRSGSSKPCSCQKVSMSKLRTSIHYNQQTGLGRTQYKITRFVSWSTPWSRYLVWSLTQTCGLIVMLIYRRLINTVDTILWKVSFNQTSQLSRYISTFPSLRFKNVK